ncbi:hypothetical protein BD324DRAFT_678265 [Kockovaella imperatae]|uniref:RING-type domain-containing protein n=1 Tax=Kockovaella imperatae TaxID=4999 RepID=A0A1Y1UUH6_9TREE|nr:hypothetical protein BD324DRAFT_678265 [Kockovaella imperatae]ORX40845.1 hypothetical protein BD324DRAFT_678265 [Kockovaella imperatae]
MPRDHKKHSSRTQNQSHPTPYTKPRPPSHPSQPLGKHASSELDLSQGTAEAGPSKYLNSNERKRARKERRRSKSRDGQAAQADLTATPATGDGPSFQGGEGHYGGFGKPKILSKAKSILSPAAKANGAETSMDSSPTLITTPKHLKKKMIVDPVPEKPKDDVRVQLLERQLKNMRKETEKVTGALNAQIAGLKEEIQALKSVDVEHQKVMEEKKKMHDALTEAVTCQICFEPFNDPHILTCGHVACKGCFISYFRSPGAYATHMENIGPDKDLTHFRKLCHTCRAPVVNRPSRMYGLASILEALGLDANMPSPSQERPAPADDPWLMSFPPATEDYRYKDVHDSVSRCRDCGGEIDVDQCVGCGAVFSEHESMADSEEEMWDLGHPYHDPDVTDSEAEASNSGAEAGGAALRRRLRRRDQRRRRMAEGGDDSDADSVVDATAEDRQFRRIMRGEEAEPWQADVLRTLETGNVPARRRRAASEPEDSEEDRLQGYLQQTRQRRDHLLDLVADVDALGDDVDYPEDPDDSDELYDGEDSEQYEDSFIDDEEDLGHVDGGSDQGSVQSASSASEGEIEEIDVVVDEPRRAGRRGAGRARRRLYNDPDEEDD